MKNKGFTLVELLVSISLILLLFTITVPAGIKLSNNAKAKECKNIKDEILTAVDLYVMDHIVNGKVSFTEINLRDLYNANLIEEEYSININKSTILNGVWKSKNGTTDIIIILTKNNSSSSSDAGYYTYSFKNNIDICKPN